MEKYYFEKSEYELDNLINTATENVMKDLDSALEIMAKDEDWQEDYEKFIEENEDYDGDLEQYLIDYIECEWGYAYFTVYATLNYNTYVYSTLVSCNVVDDNYDYMLAKDNYTEKLVILKFDAGNYIKIADLKAEVNIEDEKEIEEILTSYALAEVLAE